MQEIKNGIDRTHLKGVISRQVGLGVKANTRAYVFTEVSALTSSTPDGAERSDNSSNSFK